jgi:hypothetical protein
MPVKADAFGDGRAATALQCVRHCVCALPIRALPRDGRVYVFVRAYVQVAEPVCGQ